MTMTRRGALTGLAALSLAGCSAEVPEDAGRMPLASTDGRADKIDLLTQKILGLGPNVLPEEAARVARISVEDPLVWAREWGAVDGPLLHNMKVNMGARPRGLCNHWAEDLEKRLRRERLQSLSLHRAIANADNVWLLEHSTVILTARGAPMDSGIVLDPWREGQGRLWFGLVEEDVDYVWVPRAEVFAMKRARDARRGR